MNETQALEYIKQLTSDYCNSLPKSAAIAVAGTAQKAIILIEESFAKKDKDGSTNK